MSPLKRWRLEKGLSQEQLATAITSQTHTHIKQGMISKWERGSCKPGLDCFLALKKFSHNEINEESFLEEDCRGASA